MRSGVAPAVNTGAVHEHVDIVHVFDRALEVRPIAEVCLHEARRPPSPRIASTGLRTSARVSAVNDHLIAVGRQVHGDRSADTARRASHERGLVSKVPVCVVSISTPFFAVTTSDGPTLAENHVFPEQATLSALAPYFVAPGANRADAASAVAASVESRVWFDV
jgi:hypothetical protein